MDIKERGLNIADWVLLTQDKRRWWDVAKTAMILCARYDLSIFLTI
jgi:hypothetical protein